MYELGFIIGLIIVYLSTKILKYAIKEPRPIKGFNDFGMPSTSSAIVTFSVIYSTVHHIILCIRHLATLSLAMENGVNK